MTVKASTNARDIWKPLKSSLAESFHMTALSVCCSEDPSGLAAVPRLGLPQLGALAGLLTEARAAAGDLDTFLILLTVMLRASPSAGLAEPGGLRWTNMRSIADSTGIPKETVRRKVNDLIATGLVARSGTRLTITSEAVRLCRDVTTKLVRLMAAST